MNKTIITPDELTEFVHYVDSFYNCDTGIYPIKGVDITVITVATQYYIDSPNNIWGGGDSIDRERVVHIIINDMGYNHICPCTPCFFNIK